MTVQILDGVDDLQEEVLHLRLRETLSTLHQVTQRLPVKELRQNARRWSTIRESSSDTDYPQSACIVYRCGGG